MHSSSSVPTLPPARPNPRGGGSASSSRISDPGHTIEKLMTEQEKLKRDVHREQQKFQTMYIRDFRGPARRRLDPMRKLVAEQSEATSVLLTEAMIKQQRMEEVAHRATLDMSVQQRRMRDVAEHENELASLEEALATADGDAADACDRQETYEMMEKRLTDLVAEDQARINTIQRVIDESGMRLQQWHAVSKEGEAELQAAELELFLLRGTIKTERTNQRKMMGERRNMVESMVKYTNERNARMQTHKDRMLAGRGDLDAEGEQQLRTAAGTIDALRAINEPSAKQVSK
mgnify:CR=1 FL=1